MDKVWDKAEIGKVHGGRLSVEATFLGWSDPQYLWWMESGEGKDQKDQRMSVEIAAVKIHPRNKMKPTNPNAHTYDNEPRNQSYERRERECKVWSGKWKVWSVKCKV